MSLLDRRLLIAAALSAAASPALARFTLSDADRTEILGHALPVLDDVDVDRAFESAHGQAMIAAFVDGAEKHIAARGCSGAPRGEDLRTYSRALLVDMGKAAAAAVRAPLRLPAAFEQLVATQGLARVEALARALADPTLRRYLDLLRPLDRAQLVDGLQADLSRDFARRNVAIFQDEDVPSATSAIPIDTTEALALGEQLKDDPAFRIYSEMKGAMLDAAASTADPQGLRALMALSFVDRFKDRLAVLCIG